MIYRKQGHVVRWENGTLIRVTESGAAREEGELFECWPDGSTSRRVFAPSGVDDVVAALRHMPIERLIVTRGVAHHQYDDREWRDETDRIHASLVHRSIRALVDATTRRLDDLLSINDALQRCEGERPPPRHLRLAPNVAAAVLPFVADAKQTAGGIDGYGNKITETSINFYRPSYRVRPVRMSFNLRLEHERSDIDENLPRAIAIIAPVTGTTLRVLIEERTRVYVTTITVDKIEAVAAERIWYPYAAGSFGAEMML